MKKKKLISVVVLFGLALSSCERCSDDTKDRNVTNRNVTNDKEILAEKELTEEDKFYSEAQVACDAVSEASNRVGEVSNSSDHNTLNKAKALEAYAESLDKLALILDRCKSKNWKIISISDNGYIELSAEYCRAGATNNRILASQIRTATENAMYRAAVVRYLTEPTEPDICLICRSSSENPRECPSCYKQCCYDCILQYLNGNRDRPCPCCRAKIALMPNDR